MIWSLRNIQNFVYNACPCEFEDIITETDDVDMMTPPAYSPVSRAINKAVVVSTEKLKSSALLSVNPYGKSIDLWYEYEIYFVILDFPWHVASTHLLKNWRRRCRFAVCFIIEAWTTEISALESVMPFFNQFDLICVGTINVVAAMSEMTTAPVMYLAPGVDTLRFYPQIDDKRNFDVCNLGRRSEVTHEALLSLAESGSFCYYYELSGGSGKRISSPAAHRTLTANILKSSRYFITNRAKVNLPKLITGDSEIGYRFFEGAAAGTVMIGAPPEGNHFKKYFPWEDAVIPIEFDQPDIGDIIRDLDAQPDYLRQVRINNVANTLRSHDWVYRWEQILEKLGLPSTEAMAVRKARLKALASDLESELPAALSPALSSYETND
ncbi:MAG: glycosyltransferase [Cyanobacteria bacterium J06649_4]